MIMSGIIILMSLGIANLVIALLVLRAVNELELEIDFDCDDCDCCEEYSYDDDKKEMKPTKNGKKAK
jgi:hypothetical protein